MLNAPGLLATPFVDAQGLFFINYLDKSTTMWEYSILIFARRSFWFCMDSKEFSSFRKVLNKTQKQMAQLLGTSVKAIHSYEQGWRRVPAHAERQLFFLISRLRGGKQKPCWVVKKCPPKRKINCPAWEFHAGKLCWFVSGTICEGKVHKNWNEKMKICRACEVLSSLTDPQDENS